MTGDQADIAARLKSALPEGWYHGDTPTLDAILAGCAVAWAYCHTLLDYVRTQTRIATATGIHLDIMARDYFGAWLARFVSEGDRPFSLRIRANLLPERGTRAGVIAAVQSLLGTTPTVFEPADTGDTGGWGDGTPTWRGMAYGIAGGWGSLALPFQAFLTVQRQHGGGVANVQGYVAGNDAVTPAIGGYGVGWAELAARDMILGRVPDDAVFQVISDAMPAGSIAWTRITG